MAAVAIAGCIVAFALTFRFSTTTPAAMMSGMGAEFFPRLVIAVMVVLAVCIAFGVGSPPMEKPAPVPVSVWITAGVLFAFVAAVELIGMWLASFVLVVGLGRMWGEKNYLRTGVAAIGLLAVIYLVFVRVLKGNFPGGLVAGLWS
ncbi:MAG TPA: tripartite tricarboxylate transporter TctB family protein [Burkholderiaceae bacterium]|nr:tripartite tricarboxylate transporter TctB family protein [Burkholderiaceae bacterium]